MYRRCGTPIKHSGLPSKPAHHSQKEFMELAIGKKRRRSMHQPERAAAKAARAAKSVTPVKSIKVAKGKKTAKPGKSLRTLKARRG
jgi:hypothetical protein